MLLSTHKAIHVTELHESTLLIKGDDNDNNKLLLSTHHMNDV